jgi:iron(III) transport system ATP-binding protein
MVSIQIRDITKSFGTRVVLDHINLSIRAGEFFFLLGPSGCGKTTLLRLLAGFDQPDSGDLCFNDNSILDRPAHKRNTGMVFQHYALWPHMTVAENVMYGLGERGVVRHEKDLRTKRGLERVHMQDYATRYPNQLSGGQQQRVALARALVIEPDVVLLDEPLSNLDASLRAEMREEISRLHSETGMTMVYVTHDQHEALSMASTIAVMSNGHIEQTGRPSHIYDKPLSRFVADFLGAANWIPGVLESCTESTATVRAQTGVITGVPASDELHVGCTVLCMVRPENMTLSQTRSEENRIQAKLLRTIYLGSSSDLLCESASGPLRCHHAGRLPPDLAPNHGLDLSFSTATVRVFPHPG